MKRGKKIFDNCNETGSQEEFLRRCRFALQDTPPESVPVVGVASQSDDAADGTVPVQSEVEVENHRGGTLVKEDRLEIPLRDVVKAIVMNSSKTEEQETQTTISCVQALIQKGIKFP